MQPLDIEASLERDPDSQISPDDRVLLLPQSRWGRIQHSIKENGGKIAAGLIIALIAAVLVVLIAKTFAGGAEAKPPAARSDTKLCTTPGCVTLAADLLASMDTKADPCQDFYQYACGSWPETNPIPDDKPRWGTFQVLSEENSYAMRKLLETRPDAAGKMKFLDAELPYQTRARTFYASCMNMTAIDARGAQPLLQLMQQHRWDPSNDTMWRPEDLSNLTSRIAGLQRIGVNPMFSFFVYADDKQSNVNVGHLSQAGIGLPDRAYYFKDKTTDPVLRAYFKYIGNMFSLAQHNITAEEVDQLFEFEHSLAKIMLSKAELRDPVKTYNKHVSREMPYLFPPFHWGTLFAAVFPFLNGTAQDNIPIIVSTPTYMESLGTLLVATNKRVIQLYLQWRLIAGFGSHLSQPFLDEQYKFNKIVFGLQAETPRWKTCTSRTDSIVSYDLGRMFVDKKFAGSSQQTMLDMIAKIKRAFDDSLDSLEWMDDKTRKAARGKAEAMGKKIGFPDWIYNDTRLDEYYQKLSITPDYFGNMISSFVFDMEKNYADLIKPVDKEQWHMSPPTVNAYYSPSGNEIAFPAGILQPPFFKADYPMAYNYGGIGMVAAHEISHGFDDTGSQYDKEGNLVPWWEPHVVQNFQARTQCIRDQYSEYTVNGEPVNGNLTLGENIADNGGVKQAFEAYKMHVHEHGEEPELPAVGLTAEQLFFVGFAQAWCGAARPQEASRLLLVDTHSPAKFRVIGAVSNFEQFSTAFNCPAGSPMNPQQKCQVW